jgi:large subunit ribosomal protein L15
MRLGDLKPAKGAVHRKKRVGIGTGSGHGGTSCRGNKGQNARAGKGKTGVYFEGGQLPHHRRNPKVGFRPFTRVPYQVVNVGDLTEFPAGARVTPGELKAMGLIRKAEDPVKLLATGEVGAALTVHVDASSEAARKKIEGAGGSVKGRENG